jgi:hypothetical protein
MRHLRLLVASSAVSCVVAVVACSGAGGDNLIQGDGSAGDDGAASDDSTGSDGQSRDGASNRDSRAGDDGSARDSSGDDGGIGDAGGDGFDGNTCTGLQCNQVSCADGGTTSISGLVLDPALANPVYNAIVYVPNGKVGAIAHGPTCDHCADKPSGDPIAITLTGADGTFVLPNAPVGSNIPLVIQIGKWRRQLTVQTVTACVDNPITNHDQTRLPAKKSEGDLPVIAIASGGCDAIECMLRKIGIADSEFTAGGGGGSVQIYQGMGGSSISVNAPQAATLWSSASTLANFDMLINACECDPTVSEKPQPALDTVHAWADMGGRMMGTHYQFYWVDPAIVTASATSPWADTASFFTPEAIGADPIIADVDTSYPKGQAFASWLLATKASTMSGQVSIANTRFDVTDVVPPSSRWLTAYNAGNPGDGGADGGDNALLHYSFQTPVGGGDGGSDGGADGGGPTCGKVGFSDFHSSADPGGATFPTECVTATMSPEELALEFLFFDTQACIQDDSKAPQPPPIK